jgi:hypothetical protein
LLRLSIFSYAHFSNQLLCIVMYSKSMASQGVFACKQNGIGCDCISLSLQYFVTTFILTNYNNKDNKFDYLKKVLKGLDVQRVV